MRQTVRNMWKTVRNMRKTVKSMRRLISGCGDAFGTTSPEPGRNQKSYFVPRQLTFLKPALPLPTSRAECSVGEVGCIASFHGQTLTLVKVNMVLD